MTYFTSDLSNILNDTDSEQMIVTRVKHISLPFSRAVLKQFSDVPRFKEHILFHKDNDHRDERDHDRLHTFGLLRHCNLFLQKIDKEMEDHTGQYRTVTCEIHPGDDEPHGDPAQKEVDHIQRIHHKGRLVGTLNENQRKMPERPKHAEDHGFPEPVHIVSDGILTVALPSDLFDDRRNRDRKKCACDSDAGKGKVLRERKLLRRLPQEQG